MTTSSLKTTLLLINLPLAANRVPIFRYMSNKIEVKKLITACKGLSEGEKSTLRGFLDRSIVGIDSMTNNGNLIEISYLKCIISDNREGNFDDGYI